LFPFPQNQPYAGESTDPSAKPAAPVTGSTSFGGTATSFPVFHTHSQPPQAAHNAPLSYPVGTDRAALTLLAPTKDHAIDINSANALAALNLLGVPNPPQGAEQRRLLFLLHIGILH